MSAASMYRHPAGLVPSSAACAIIKEFEGYKDVAYRCPAGKWTIGWGHTKGVRQGQHCTREQAEKWLEADLADAAATVRQAVRVPLNQHQFDALVSLAFNIPAAFGSTGLMTLLRAGDYASAAQRLLLYNKGRTARGFEVLPGLVRRRAAEHALFMKGAEVV